MTSGLPESVRGDNHRDLWHGAYGGPGDVPGAEGVILLEWSEFARRLGRELAALDTDTILIVREREESRHYVQAMREPDRLYAEAVSNNFLDGPLLLTLADEEVMSDAGWRPPGDPAPRNWWTELPAFAGPEDHGRLADVMVTALRDVQGVRRPSDLVYESFHRHGTGLIELPDFGIDVADPGRIEHVRPATGELPPLVEAPPPAGTGAVPHANGAAPAFGETFTAPAPDLPDELEPLLADAKQRADHATYFELLLTAALVIPAPAVPGAGLPTTTIGSGVYVTVFTSPQALAAAHLLLPGTPLSWQNTSFGALLAVWPDPAWQLAVNPGLPSEVHLDVATVTRLDKQQRTAPAPEPPATPPVTPPAAQATPPQVEPPAVPPVPSVTPPVEPPVASTEPPVAPPVEPPAPLPLEALAEPPVAEEPVPALPYGAPTEPEPAAAPPVPPVPPATPGPPVIRPSQGTRMWQATDDGELLVAVYDAIGGVWTPVRTDLASTLGTE